jgi:AcrR family transcriptional regulator
MSRENARERVRPTREQTRQRLFEAAAEVFATRGIGAATVEAIAQAAGLTRGAFYSNFGGKDELIDAMLADHVERSAARYLELLARHRAPADFLAAMHAVDRSGQDPLGRSPLLHVELLMHAARAAGQRPEPAQVLAARRQIITDVAEGIGLASPAGGPFDAGQLAGMLLAMEDGFRLHRLIDPDATPADSFLRSLDALQAAFRPALDLVFRPGLAGVVLRLVLVAQTSGRAVGGIGAGSSRHGSERSCWSTAAAALRPSAIAQTISDWPRPMSPATNTPGTDVS